MAKSSRGAKRGEDKASNIWQQVAKESGFAFDIDARPGFEADDETFGQRRDALPATLTESESLFDRAELFRAVAEQMVGTGIGPEQLVPAVDHLIRHDVIVELGTDLLGLARYITPEMIDLERDTVTMTSRMLRVPGRGLDPEDVSRRCASQGLSGEQTAAVLAATGSARVTIVEGSPGVGKTTLLVPLVIAWHEAGHRVIGTATAWKIANALAAGLRPPRGLRSSW